MFTFTFSPGVMSVSARTSCRIRGLLWPMVLVALTAGPSRAENHLQNDPTETPYQVDIVKIGGNWSGTGPAISFVMADIDGDGCGELVEGMASRIIGMDGEDGQIKSRWQINLEPGWVLDQRPRLGVVADLDQDGIDEIFTAITNTETGQWRFAALSPAGQKVLFSSPLPTGPDRRADGFWDGRYYPEFLLDNADGRGRPGILFAREVRYDAFPRGLVAVDPFTGQVIWEWLCGPNPNPRSVREIDMGDQGQGIAFFGHAPDNLGGELVNGTSDDNSYAFLVSSTGRLVWRKQMSPGFALGGLEVADIGGDGRQEIITWTISGASNIPNEMVIWNWRDDRPLAGTRSNAGFMGVVVLEGPGEGTNWLVAGSSEGLVTRYLYTDGTLVPDARVLGWQKKCRLTGAVDILPEPGPEILISCDENDDFFLLDRDLNTLVCVHDEHHRATRNSPVVWAVQPGRSALVAGSGLGYWVMEFQRRPLAWGPLLARAGAVLAGMALLWVAFLLGRRWGRRQREERGTSHITDRESLYRLWLDLDDVKHERMFEPSKGFRRLVWLLDAFTTDLNVSADLSVRIEKLMTDFREVDLPRLQGILARAEGEQVAPEVVGRTTMVLASTAGKLDALSEGRLTVPRVQAVHKELAADMEKIEEGFLELWRKLGDFYTADPVGLIQGLLLVREVEFKRAGITIQAPTLEAGPAYLCRIDSSALRYVLGNLLDNAMRAVAGSEHKKITITLIRRDLEIIIGVTDTGRGISAQDQERIFSGRFSSRGGGQGLFRSREILHRWRGEIILDTSEPGKGTTFMVELPAAVKKYQAKGRQARG